MLSLSKHDAAWSTLSFPVFTLAATDRMLRQAQHDVCFDELSMTL
jgi:hypothetical protein